MESPSFATSFKFADFGLTLKAVPAQSAQFITVLDRVRADLHEALRERCEKQSTLESCPGKKAWIDGAINDTRRALSDIGAQVEGPRVDIQVGGSVTLKHRLEWVLRNHERFLAMEPRLRTCHASLLVAINALHTLQSTTGATTSPPAYDDLLCGEANKLHSMTTIKSPAARRPKRTMSTFSESAVGVLPVEIDSTPTNTTVSPQERLESSWWDTVPKVFSPAWQSVPCLSLTTFEPTSPRSPPSTLTDRHDSMFDIPQPPPLQSIDQDILSPELEAFSLGRDPLDAENERFNGSVKADLLRRSTVQQRRRKARAQFR